MIRPASRACVAMLVVGAIGCARRAPSVTGSPSASHQFTFAWPFRDGDTAVPRGGTTTGPAVELATGPGEAWRRLREPGLSALERDRRAILAMAGTYRTSFDFLEIVGFRPGFVPDRPYQSWATEYVYVAADEPRFIRLQHVLVMFVRNADGAIEGPLVTKHWRQDWRYEARERLEYRGRNTWAKVRLRPDEVRGAWTQSVFQVDDSPRYAATGRWEHFGNLSTWLSGTTWRPLPRREFSVRHDYDVLVGTNRHTITPTGWVQEEDNVKVVLGDDGRPATADPVLAEEVGLNRYERLARFDDSAARRYAERTQPFWDDVRAAWDDVIATHERFTLRAAPDQGQLFTPLFEYADRLYDGAPFDGADARRVAGDTVTGYLADGSRGGVGAY
jgi:uncharacterized protein DUF6607